MAGLLLTNDKNFKLTGGLRLPEILARRSNNRPLRTATFGNSLYAGTSGLSFSDHAIRTLGPYLNQIKNGGVAGNTSTMMIARMVADIPLKSEVVIFGEGPNDAGSLTVLQHRTNMETILKYILSIGAIPVLVASSPRNTYETLINSYVAAEMALAEKYGITFIDPWDGLVDRSTGTWGAGNSPDGIHPTFDGHHTAGIALAAGCIGTTKTTWRPRCNVGGTAGYCLAGNNRLMLTASGGLATDWTKIGSGTTVETNATAPGGYIGNFQKIAAASSTGNPYLRRRITTGWNAGDELMVVMSYQIDATYGEIAQITATIDGSTGVTLIYPTEDLTNSGAMFLYPTSTTQIDITAIVYGPSATVSVAFGEFEVYNLTALLTR